MDAAERWVPCTRDERYEVSDLGRVRRRGRDRCLVPVANTKQGREGYLKIKLGKYRQVYVHQLVAEAFIGPCPAGHDVDHEDHDRANNALSNLRYLPKLVNAFRWKDRTPDGRNVWESPYLDGMEPPEDHEPLSEEETHAIDRDLRSAGW